MARSMDVDQLAADLAAIEAALATIAPLLRPRRATGRLTDSQYAVLTAIGPAGSTVDRVSRDTGIGASFLAEIVERLAGRRLLERSEDGMLCVSTRGRAMLELMCASDSPLVLALRSLCDADRRRLRDSIVELAELLRGPFVLVARRR